MKSHKKNPPNIAKKLLNLIIPDAIKDEISGDLEEEYYHHLKMGNSVKQAGNWYWSQTLTTCIRYLFTFERLTTYLITALTFFILAIIFVGITVLSYGNVEYFQDDFWTNGNVHLLFFETKFWDYSSTSFLNDLTLNTFIDSNSFIWSLVSLFILFRLDLKYNLTAINFAIIGLIAMFSGQIYGMIYFKMAVLENKEAGPLIALMWLTIMYMILPISYTIIKKISLKKKEN